MNEQYEKSLTKLELDKVLAMLSDHAASQAAKERCLAVRPSTDADEIRHLLDETSAACACITVKGSPSFGGLYDVGASLDRADRGGCLSPEELLRIAAVLKSARQTKAYSEGEGRSAQESSVLDVYFQQITTNKYLEERIFTSILSKDEIADAASSELASIRRKIRQQSSKIRESLQKIITSPSYAKILQEPIVTIRSDRFVVPVKAECKSQLPGLAICLWLSARRACSFLPISPMYLWATVSRSSWTMTCCCSWSAFLQGHVCHLPCAPSARRCAQTAS